MGKIPQIPDPTSVQFSQAIKQWIEVAEGVRGPAFPLDRAVKVKDLIDPDFINKLAGYEFPITKVPPDYGYIGDESAPRPPTNLQVTNEVFRNILTWDDPTSDNFWYIEVFRAKVPAGDPAPTVVDAIKIASVPKTVETFIDTEIFVTSYDYYYWIRAVSYAGVASLWQDGYIPGATTVGGMIDSIMEILKGADPAAWSSIVNYVVDDRVLHADKRYKCILANLNQEPPNTTYWERSGILITGEVGGVPTVGVDGNLIVDGTILARCINVDDAFIGATIQSTVFTSGSAGWQINKNGDVEFNSGVFRGTTVWENIDGAPAFPSDEHLVGYWPFDDGSGSVAVDASGNDNDGTLTNMEDADWKDGVVGKCLDFDGTNEYVDCGTIGPVTTDKLTISFWTNNEIHTNTNRNPILEWYTSPGERLILVKQHTFLRRFAIYNGVWRFFSTAYYPTGTTKEHIVITISGTSATLRISGIEKQTIFIGTAYTEFSGSFRIGSFMSGVHFLKGPIDELRVYDTALTESEIKALYLYPAGSGSTKISGGQITTGKIKSADANTYFDLDNKKLVFNGKATFASATAGVFIGNDSGTYKLNIGDATHCIKWDGSDLSIIGSSVNVPSAGNIPVAAAVTDSVVAGEAAYKKAKEITIPQAGTLRIKFTMYQDSWTIYGKIFRNGSPVGAARSVASGPPVTYSEDIAGWSAGDLCQLYAYNQGSGQGHVYNFILYANQSLTYVATIDLEDV